MQVSSAVLGTVTTVVIALAGWAYSQSATDATQDLTLQYHEKRIEEVEKFVSENQKALIDIQKSTVELLHRQDKRLTLVENELTREKQYEKSKL